LPQDYPLAIHAGCGRLFSSPEMFGRPASEGEAAARSRGRSEVVRWSLRFTIR
jgi:hypothetical protein